jgi:hypothetical protein
VQDLCLTSELLHADILVLLGPTSAGSYDEIDLLSKTEADDPAQISKPHVDVAKVVSRLIDYRGSICS